ncbi:MAG: zinc ABC transporter substrate-binding protein [Desulfuromonadales bacterium]|nr:zinc ABC transporter substrate-binding protein [Desulfuromonadales bacterium]
MKKWLILFVILLIFLAPGCSKHDRPSSGKLNVVTTLFPVYDFAKNVGGNKVDVTLILPPGVEPHSFEPTPQDIVKINQADIFIFTSRDMEPWAVKLLEGGTGKALAVEAGRDAKYISAVGGDDDDDGGRKSGRDPHIWLDLDNAAIMVDAIAEGMAQKQPESRAYFMANAAAYKSKLKSLDDKFKEGLSVCKTREFLHGGHYAFAYLAKRYNLSYRSAYGMTADSEPTPKQMMELIQQVKRDNIKYIFYEELLSPRIAETIAQETGAKMLELDGIHNLTKDELSNGATYIGLMEMNLENLRKGLECQ